MNTINYTVETHGLYTTTNKLTRDMLDAIVSESKRIIVYRHKMPDGDAYASQYGIAKILEDTYGIEVICRAEADTNYSIHEKFYKGAISSSDDITIKSTDFVIVVDTKVDDRIAKGTDKINNAKHVLYIDHHQVDETFELDISNSNAGSAAEIIGHFAMYLNLTISNKAAYYLLVGILTDTGVFRFTKFNNAKNIAIALANIFSPTLGHNRVLDMLIKQLRKRTAAEEAYLGLMAKEATVIGGVTSVVVTKELVNKLVTEFDLSFDRIAKMAALVKGVIYEQETLDTSKFVFSVQNPEDGLYKVSFRVAESTGTSPLNIAKSLGGGGHTWACGADNVHKLDVDVATLLLGGNTSESIKTEVLNGTSFDSKFVKGSLANEVSKVIEVIEF